MAQPAKKQPAQDVAELLRKLIQSDPVALSEAIRLVQAEAGVFIDGKVKDLKNSNSGRTLPVEVLRTMLTRHDDCSCRVATRLLENP
jgi:hypothetical protein